MTETISTSLALLFLLHGSCCVQTVAQAVKIHEAIHVRLAITSSWGLSQEIPFFTINTRSNLARAGGRLKRRTGTTPKAAGWIGPKLRKKRSMTLRSSGASDCHCWCCWRWLLLLCCSRGDGGGRFCCGWFKL